MEDEEEKWGEHRADDTDIVCLFLIIIVFTTLQNDEESVPAVVVTWSRRRYKNYIRHNIKKAK